ncbi:GtrA family protein [Lacisediminihabitans sp.]|jgi:putative flippase GtrA|uniref:GtrA family protein n=1 Tax=Lacisediminihabitans sp. TaxID=2787631 RepID=UPI002F9593B9
MSDNTTANEAAASKPRGLVGLIRRLLQDERARFVIVGGFNTVVGYGIFVLVQLTIGKHTSYLLSLYIATIVGTIVAFLSHRRFTFRISGRHNVFIDFFRFAGVNVVALVINTIALPLLVEFGGLNPLVAQALIVIVTTVVSYVGHKFFSFRRRKSGRKLREVE